MYKCNTNQLTILFHDLFQRTEDIHKYATRYANMLHVPLVKLTIVKNAIRSRLGVYLWNELSNKLNVISITSFSLYKKNVKIVY